MINGSNVLRLADTVFHQFQSTAYLHDKNKFLSSRAILTSLNSDVNRINESLLNQFEGNYHTLLSSDELCKANGIDMLIYPIELLRNIESGSLPPHSLKFKMRCLIMLLRNLNPSKGLVSGTRLICLSINTKVI